MYTTDLKTLTTRLNDFHIYLPGLIL